MTIVSPRPALSGPGSSAAAWRSYAAAITNSAEQSWSALSRDEIIAELQEQGVLDAEGNPTAAEAASAPKDQQSPATPEDGPGSAESAPPSTSPGTGDQSDTLAEPPISEDGSTDSPTAPSDEGSSPDSSENDGQADETDQVGEIEDVGIVTDPCRVCYPQGWPVKQAGASASCHHGLTIRRGEQVVITKEQAITMGFLKE